MRLPILLLVEDEPVIALHLQGEFEALGYQVIKAADAPEALLLSAQHLPDLAVLNFHHQNAPDGMALAQALRTRYLIKVYFITGCCAQDLQSSESFFAGHEVLNKPFTRLQLRNFLFSENPGFFPR